MAIAGIKGNKRMGIDNPDGKKKLQHGWINDQNQLCLSTTDATKIQSKYSSFNFNRVDLKGKQFNKKKEII